MTDFHVVIPARYASSRLPGKPLVDIAGKPMIQHVIEIAKASGAKTVTVATDDKRILEVVSRLGDHAVMTKEDHASGTDRITEACNALGLVDDDIVVNLQGDEPLMPAALLSQVAGALQDASMATLCTSLDDDAQFTDPATVKVITNQDSQALYFSRAPIPWVRQDNSSDLAKDAYNVAFRHLGIYAYTSGYLKQFANRSVSPLEQYEQLEQLRVLWHGESINCPIAEVIPPAGVDNKADLARVRSIFMYPDT